MRIQIAVPDEHVTPEVVEPVLEAVTRLDEHMIRSGQTPTSRALITAGAVWRPENMGDEHFDHGATIAQRGWGDCDDWAPLHAASLRASGEDPGARARLVQSGENTFHALVQRSNGTIEDPSVAAGMKSQRPSNISGEGMSVYACDPHDGRIYQGSLLPTVGPLSMHCGPGIAVRGCVVTGVGPIYEARVDLPIAGSPLVRVRSFTRHRPGHRRRIVGNVLPHALVVTHMARSSGDALHGAVVGAILAADASEMVTSLDRYKLLAMQGLMAGQTPGQVHQALQAQMQADLHAAAAETGVPAEAHAAALRAAATGRPPAVVGGIFDDIAHIATSVVSDVGNAASGLVSALGHVPWGDIIHDVEAAVSVVPGLGTAVADVLATAETAYESAAALLGGNALAAAIHAAYNYAMASIPGAAAIRPVLDPVVNTLIDITVKHEPPESAVLNNLLNAVPDSPKIGPLSPKSLAATLVKLIVGKLGVKATSGTGPVFTPGGIRAPVAAAQAAQASAAMRAAQAAAAKARPAPAPLHLAPAPRHVTLKPLGVPHAAVPMSPALPPHPLAAMAPTLARPTLAPGSPGAPPGATHWHCHPLPGGQWACQWM